MIKTILYAFFILQTLFFVLDWTYLKRNPQRHGLDRKSVFFLVLTWILFFALQNLGTLLLPGFDSMKTHFFTRLGISADGESQWTLACTLFFVWSFHVVSFWDFATHRWVLHSRYFWIFHEYHHLPKIIFNGMPGISARPYVFVTTFLTFVGSYLFIMIPMPFVLRPVEQRAFLELGLPGLALLLTLILSIGHSIVLRRLWSVHYFLKWISIATPQEHILHHSSVLRCNYGNFSTIWDRIFKSYVHPRTVDFENEKLGLDYDQDFLGTLCGGRWKLSKNFRKKFNLGASVWVKP